LYKDSLEYIGQDFATGEYSIIKEEYSENY